MSSTTPNNYTENWKDETIEQTRDRIRRVWGDYILTILIINPINLRIVRFLGHSAVTPNQLTIVSFAIRILAAICLLSLTHSIQVIGGGLILLSFLIDCLDGDLARLKGMMSPLGAMLDPIFDRFGEIAVILCISINGWRTTHEPIWLIGGIFLVGISQMYFYCVDALVWKLPEKQPKFVSNRSHKTIKGTRVRIGTIEPFVWGQAFLAFAGVVYWGVPIFLILFSFGCLKTIYFLIKKSFDLQSKDPEHYGIHTR